MVWADAIVVRHHSRIRIGRWETMGVVVKMSEIGFMPPKPASGW